MTALKEMRGTLYAYADIQSTGNAASTGTLPMWVAHNDCTITAITLLPQAAITANGTDYAVYTATRYTAAGGSATTVATRSWIATNSVAVATEAMTLSGTAANLVLEAGQVLAMVKTVAGNGLVIPMMTVVIAYKLNGV
jgi:hypothetical protein